MREHSRYDIAIVGMGCVFPGAHDAQQYTQNILSGETFFSEMPKRLWHLDNFCSKDGDRPEKSYTTVGSFVEGFEFPYSDYRLPPKTLQGVDPAQLITLEVTRQALRDAGIEARDPRLANAATVIGASGVDQFAHATTFLNRFAYLEKVRPALAARGMSEAELDALEARFQAELESRGHVWNAGTASVGAITSSLSNRVAQVFGVGGFNMTVDAACASSFVALDVACCALMAGDVNIAIAGGADLGTNPAIYIGFSRVDGLSRKGNSNPFDASADGLIIGEGAGVVVLKRLEDAKAEGDRVHAVIRGVGSSSDGAGLAVYAPSLSGRKRALRNALSKAGVEAAEVQYVEAHATSTIVGDASEYDAISMVYGEGRDASDPLRVGSVKYQIGHLKAAAGVAGLIKTVLCMEKGLYPGMPRFEQLTPEATLPTDAIEINTEVKPWIPRATGRRVAAITSAGFGGVNYHCVIEQGEDYGPVVSRPAVSQKIAVVGVTCRVAGADNVDSFWDNITHSRELFHDADAKKLGWQDHLDVGPKAERITTHRVSSPDDFKFDLLRHRIFPKAVSQIAPTQLLGLDLSDRLLQDAGFDIRESKRIGVSVGAMHDDYFPDIFMPMLVDEYADAMRIGAGDELDAGMLDEVLAVVGEEFRGEGPPVTEHTLPGWMTNVIAGRIANKLNLHGPNFTVDSACSSGLAALLPATYQLLFGDVDYMISGGLNRQLSAPFTCGVCALGAVAEDEARPYDVDGAGFLIGEGGVFYLLRRLEDAQRDGDDILAVIHGIGGSSEAHSKSMVAPSERAVRRAIRNAMNKTDIVGEQVGVVETHGSANPLSDQVEASSVAAELRADLDDDPIQLTAIKSHLGHLYGGSGAASMLSTILALRTNTVPGIRGLRTPRPEIAELSKRVLPRIDSAPLSSRTSVGGVNSLGLGGANYFVLLTSGETKPALGRVAPRPSPTVRQSDVFVCFAQDQAGLTRALRKASQGGELPSVISDGDALRLAITHEDRAQLSSKLGDALRLLDGGHALAPLESKGVFLGEGDRARKLAWCFPGQGTQYLGMGKALYESEPAFRAVFDQVHGLSMSRLGFDLKAHAFADPGDEDRGRALATLVGAQVSAYAVELGVARVLTELGLVPDVLIGHSFGEFVALTVAGVWTVEVGLSAIQARVEAAQRIIDGGPPLAMISIVGTDKQRDALIALGEGRVFLTNVNAPGRFVCAGPKQDIEKIASFSEPFGVDAKVLPIGSAFHSPYMEPALEPFCAALAALPCATAQLPILSTVTGEYLPKELSSKRLAEHLATQLVTPIDTPREINRLHAEGVRDFLEVGPGWAMTRMVHAILADREFRAVPTLHPKVGDAETFRRARAFLIATGHLAVEKPGPASSLDSAFMGYLEQHEPAVLALLAEARARFDADAARPRALAPVVALRAVETPPSPSPAQAPQSAAAAASTAAASGGRDLWIARIRERLVEMTGYPAEMLEAELDLEADLGIDSVQRVEIWSIFVQSYGIDSDARAKNIRTIAQMAELLASLTGDDDADESDAGDDDNAAPVAAAGAGAEVSAWVERVRVRLVDLTGYPPEMLEEELDLEADLGIDSVQRVEIWSTFVQRYELDTDVRPKNIRTIAQMAQLLAELAGGGDKPSAEDDAQAQAPSAGQGSAPAEDDERVCRLFVPTSQALTADQLQAFDCKRVIAIVDGEEGWAQDLVQALEGHSAELELLSLEQLAKLDADAVSARLARADTLAYLAHHSLVQRGWSSPDAAPGVGAREALDREVTALYGAFRALVPHLSEHPMRVLVPISRDGTFGTGRVYSPRPFGAFPGGFVRSLARELPSCQFQLIDTGNTPWADSMLRHLDVVATTTTELGGARFSREVPAVAHMGSPQPQADLLDAGDLVLVTGGARGIVFECVTALATRTGCRLLLTGRTRLPEPAPAWMSASADDLDDAIRKLEMDLVRGQGLSLGEARRHSATARKQWELGRNLRALEGAGIEASYRVCDVSDPEAFSALLDEVSADVRGIVHGAGVQRSRNLMELDDEQIARTVSTKLSPLLTLVERMDWSKVKVLSAFGSITGLFGNAGQTDYSMANDLMSWIVGQLGARHSHLHAQTIEWTAWTGTGMVTAAEEKRFAEAGLVPVDVKRGVELYLDGLLGSAHPQLAAFNHGALSGGGHHVSPYPVASRPRRSLGERLNGGTAFGARFSLKKDMFLRQHLVNSAPVVPGTFVCGVFAEAVAGEGVDLCDVSFRRPLWVREENFAVEVVRNGSSLVLLPVDRPELESRSLANLTFATCTLQPSQEAQAIELDLEEDDIEALREARRISGAPFYRVLGEKFSEALDTGPIFQGILTTLERDQRFLAAARLTDDAVAMCAQPGGFAFDPVLADMAVQAASAWVMQKHEVMAIPRTIRRLQAHAPMEGREAIIIGRAEESGPDGITLDLVVREPSGRLIMTIERLVSKTIASLEN